MHDAYDRWRWLIVILLAAPLLVLAGVLLNDRWKDPEPLTIQTSDIPVGEIEVYVTGAVVHPGVYAVPDGSRWIDALEAAGGPSADADLTAVNLAKRAQDEDQVTVPKLGAAVAAGASTTPITLVNLNTATQADLESLPGIGEVRAGQILQSRTTDGPFAQVEDLVQRSLVPASVFQDIAPLITVH